MHWYILLIDLFRSCHCVADSLPVYTQPNSVSYPIGGSGFLGQLTGKGEVWTIKCYCDTATQCIHVRFNMVHFPPLKPQVIGIMDSGIDTSNCLFYDSAYAAANGVF